MTEFVLPRPEQFKLNHWAIAQCKRGTCEACDEVWKYDDARKAKINDVPVVTGVLGGLSGNYCPLCGRGHSKGTAVIGRHAKRLEERGYLGYDYDKEAWIFAEGAVK